MLQQPSLPEKGTFLLECALTLVVLWVFCAEHAAAAAMITAGEHHIAKVVAVDWQGHPISPCGRCREFLSQLSEDNLSAQVLTKAGSLPLAQLLPLDWKDGLV